MNLNKWEENVYIKNKQINKYPYTSIISSVIRFTKDRNDKKTLDIGCGCGNNIKFLYECGFDCYGIDISKTAINIANNFLKNDNIKLSVCDSKKTLYDNNYFDLIIDRASITHNALYFSDCIKEVERIIKKDGIFITHVFGLNCTDKEYGEKINNNLYINFEDGDFKDSDTYFISKDDINIFYKNFQILDLNEVNNINYINNKNTQIFEIVLKKL